MNTKQAIILINAALKKIAELRKRNPHSPDHVAFVQTTELDLIRIFGPDSIITKNFSAIDYSAIGQFFFNPLDFEDQIAEHRHKAYLDGLDRAEGFLKSAKEQLLKHGADNILRISRIRNEGARVFISHGVEGQALMKIERFIRALGLQPIVVVRGPSEGMSVDDLVEKRMSESDCAIILATADEQVDKRRQPRPNVIHEIGLAQEKFKKKVIYLKEDDCEFPSNVRPKVWGNFTQDNMEKAFEKISAELRSYGLL